MTRLGREEWKLLVDELEKSDLSHKEFAAARGVTVATLQFWLYKFRRESRQESRPTILPVELVPSAALKARPERELLGPALLELALPTGPVLRFTAGTDIAYVRQLIAALA